MTRCRSMLAGLVMTGAAVLLSLGAPRQSQAQFEPSGALSFQGAFGEDQLGAGVLLDVHVPLSVFRIGGTVGIAGITSDDANRSRALAPVALSLGAVLTSDAGVGLDIRLRGGFWAGATNEGLAAGPWVSAGAFLLYQIAPRVALGVGADGWFAFGHGDSFVAAPGLTLAWIPGEE